jgi:hypothetical protein
LPLSELPTRQARFDAGRDELRYSLRALEQYMPWYRQLYIVTNGQVGGCLGIICNTYVYSYVHQFHVIYNMLYSLYCITLASPTAVHRAASHSACK